MRPVTENRAGAELPVLLFFQNAEFGISYSNALSYFSSFGKNILGSYLYATLLHLFRILICCFLPVQTYR